MSKKVADVLSSTSPYSKSTYIIEKLRSDGRLPDKTKPTTATDKKIHLAHIVDSSHYNLTHSHDHNEELVFDYGRLHKEDPKYGEILQNQTKRILNPVFRKMKLKLKEL